MAKDLTDDQQKTLDEARNKRAALAAKREARQPKTDPVAEEIRLLAIEQTIDDLETEHGPMGQKLCAVYAPNGVLIVGKKPAAPSYKKFMDREKLTVSALEQLCKPCLLHPTAAEYEALIDDYPGIIGAFATELTKLVGAKQEEK